MTELTKDTKRHFYAIDYAADAETQFHDGFSSVVAQSHEGRISSFIAKSARDTFVANGNRRFAKTAREATTLCKKVFNCTAQEAVTRGVI